MEINSQKHVPRNDQDDVPVVTKYTIIKNVHINWLPILFHRGKGK